MRTTVSVFLLIFFCVALSDSRAQYYQNTYRPSLEMMQLESPRFRIIFPAGQDSVARATAMILEDQYPAVQSLVGGQLRRFPVILNDHNDLSNGFVSTVPFRSEIEIPPIKGPSLNPRSGGWLESVAPHELVHALHFSNIPGGIPALVNVFSPDFARSFHGAGPGGITEGIAVFHESHTVYRESGRGNYPFFMNRFHQIMESDNPWSLGQMMTRERYSRPFDRHYLGGYAFVNWLQYTYGMETTRKSIEYFVQYPFLGFGSALRHATGKWPAPLFREFKEYQQEFRDEFFGDQEFMEFEPLVPNTKGAEFRSPVWLDDDRILFYSAGHYNRRAGFYVHHLSSGETRLRYEISIIGDAVYTLDPSANELIYSRYHTHPYHHQTYRMDLHRIDLDRWSSSRITRNARLYAPFFSGDDLFALQTSSHASSLVRLPENSGQIREEDVELISDIRPNQIVSIAPNPSNNQIAVVANKNGVQALWILESDQLDDLEKESYTVGFPNASIFNPAWNSDGTRLLFDADTDGILNIFEYHPEENRLFQITNSKFNAFMGGYSPDGEHIALIFQHNRQQLPAVLHRDDFLQRELSAVDWQPRQQTVQKMSATRLSSHLESKAEEWPVSRYRTGLSWVPPRVFGLYAEEAGTFVDNRFGITAEGTDFLRNHTYLLEGYFSNNQIWGEGRYRYSGFFPGFELSGFYRPRESSAGLLIERGASFHIPITLSISNTPRSSWWSFRPGITWREFRLDLDTVDPQIRDQVIQDWFEDPSLTFFTAYYHRLQQNLRDITPNTGTILFAQGEQYIGRDRESNPSGLRAGIIQYFSPLMRFNHTASARVEVMTQTPLLVFNTAGLVSNNFSSNVLAGFNNAASVEFRYTLPIAYVNDGWITLPFFIDRFYAVLSSNTVTNLNAGPFDEMINQSRTAFGIQLRADFRFFNLNINTGVGFGFEPASQDFNIYTTTFTGS